MSNNKDKDKFQTHLRQLFEECDIDKNGSLTRQEFRQLCSKIGFTQEAAEEAFQRLDCDRDDHISFEEFLAGFNQYQTSTSSQSNQQQSRSDKSTNNNRLQPPSDAENRPQSRTSPRLSPVASRAAIYRPPSATAPITLGSNVPSRFHPSASQIAAFSGAPLISSDGNANSTGTYSSMSGTVSSSAENSTSADSSSYYSYPNNTNKMNKSNGFNSNEFNLLSDSNQGNAASNGNDMVIYSSDLLTSQMDQATGSQYNSLISQAGGSGGGNLNASGSSLTQASCLNVQDLLDCVQKLQNENQQLSQIFFKDKRQREELISQLGEEFDQQVKQAEAAANKRARDELEAEKRRLREMMQEEREQLQHHYKTIERMSNVVKNVYEERKLNPGSGDMLDGAGNLILNGANSIDIVKSQLEDTYEENKQLKKSLLDTKTDVARIWKEMGNLKEKYEEQLTSAHERNNETKTECDHIKRQLNLMKDSNRKLQDASDVITSYITDKVEPVIKIATEYGEDYDPDDPTQQYAITGNPRLLMAGNQPSACNSRRGSVLSDYFGDEPTMEISSQTNTKSATPSNQRVGSNTNQNIAQNEEIIATTTKTTTSETPTQSISRNTSSSHVNRQHDDDKDINDWLSQPQNSSPSPEPRSAAILRRAALSRDGPRGSSSSSCSSSIPTTSLNNSSAAATASTNDNDPTTFQKRSKKSATSSSRVAFRHQKSQSIDLQSDLDELEALHTSNTKQQLDPISGAKIKPLATTGTSPTQEEQPGSVVCMVESADGPTVATYDIILVGDSFVGKSSLASRFIEGSYTKSVISTTSIDFKTKDCKVDGINYTINLWDTA